MTRGIDNANCFVVFKENGSDVNYMVLYVYFGITLNSQIAFNLSQEASNAAIEAKYCTVFY